MNNKKFFFLIIVLNYCLPIFAQNINAVEVKPNKLYYFNKGINNVIAMQTVTNLNIGMKYVTYTDFKDDFYVYYNNKNIRLTQGQTGVIMTNNHLVYQLTSILSVFDKGKTTVLTSYVGGYGVGDSLVVFQDRIGGNLKYYYRNEIKEFSQVLGEYHFNPSFIGDNVFAFKENGGNYKAFYQGKIYELISTNYPIKFSAGMNMIAFNDYQNYSFAIFDKGEIYDIENQFAKTYRAGHDFVYYQDNNEVNKVYYQGEVQELGYDLQELAVYDSIIYFKEADYSKIWYQGEIYQIYNDQVSNYQVSGGSIAYFNSSGGVSALIRGNHVEICKQKVQKFKLNGNTIVLNYTPTSFSVWWNGKMFNY